nr:MAG TPA_asm: hypothetical protein [Caudoviricetes sp.]
MEREYKFRGWCKVRNNKWVYGNFENCPVLQKYLTALW